MLFSFCVVLFCLFLCVNDTSRRAPHTHKKQGGRVGSLRRGKRGYNGRRSATQDRTAAPGSRRAGLIYGRGDLGKMVAPELMTLRSGCVEGKKKQHSRETTKNPYLHVARWKYCHDWPTPRRVLMFSSRLFSPRRLLVSFCFPFCHGSILLRRVMRVKNRNMPSIRGETGNIFRFSFTSHN